MVVLPADMKKEKLTLIVSKKVTLTINLQAQQKSKLDLSI